ncbi:MAG TPA: type II 3-dehydroquinate dehydratase [Clostridia bacterium]
MQEGKVKILIINGPNLNMLGKREPHIYGTQTLEDINARIKAAAPKECVLEFFQSNHEGAIIDKIHQTDADALIINAGAYSHYSYAIYDALKCVSIPKYEVHLSDIFKREESFRRVSVITPAVDGMYYGKGVNSYIEAVAAALEKVKQNG